MRSRVMVYYEPGKRGGVHFHPYTDPERWEEVEAGRMDPTKDRGIPWDYWRKMAAIGINATYNEPFSGLDFNDDSPNGVYLRKRWGE